MHSAILTLLLQISIGDKLYIHSNLCLGLCVFYRVKCYIKYGWDEYLIDPDQGANCHQTLNTLAAKNPNSESFKLLQAYHPSGKTEFIVL